MPVQFSYPSYDFNYYFLNDLNGDGLVDVVGHNPHLNTGNGFVSATSTYANNYIPNDTYYRTAIMDLNGDGLADYYKLPDLMYRNNGSGFVLDSEFDYWPATDPYAYYGDLNGDGLPDYFHSSHHPAGGGGTIP